MVNCGLIAIWKEIREETAVIIAEVLNEIYLEREPAEEILLDNGMAFHSETLRAMCDRWNVKSYFKAAYKLGGNGILERNYRKKSHC